MVVAWQNEPNFRHFSRHGEKKEKRMTGRIAQTNKSSSSRHVLKRGFIVSDEELNLRCTVRDASETGATIQPAVFHSIAIWILARDAVSVASNGERAQTLRRWSVADLF
jgi:hypothetical protein